MRAQAEEEKKKKARKKKKEVKLSRRKESGTRAVDRRNEEVEGKGIGRESLNGSEQNPGKDEDEMMLQAKTTSSRSRGQRESATRTTSEVMRVAAVEGERRATDPITTQVAIICGNDRTAGSVI